MDHASVSRAEIEILGALMKQVGSIAERTELARSLSGYAFIEPEHRIVYESICSLLPRDRVSTEVLAVHLNNRGFPDVNLETYYAAAPVKIEDVLQLARRLVHAAQEPASERLSDRGSGKLGAALALFFVCLIATATVLHRPIRRFIRESLMQRVTSAHYQIQCPPGALTQDVMRQFLQERESLFAAVDRRLNDAASNAEITLIFDPRFREMTPEAGAAPYQIMGMRIRTGLDGRTPVLDPAADAEALLYAAWGRPGNPVIAQWTALWLVGASEGEDLGMAAARVEQRLGHRKVAELLNRMSNGDIARQDQEALGAAWMSEIAELSGTGEVQKLYSARMAQPGMDEATRALASTSTELERKWQMWMYAYVAGMPPADHEMSMPMDMPMPK
jgi:hypothetical protein